MFLLVIRHLKFSVNDNLIRTSQAKQRFDSVIVKDRCGSDYHIETFTDTEVSLKVFKGLTITNDSRGFPKVDHLVIDVRIVLEENKFSKKS